MDDLPYIDTHELVIAADPSVVWPAVERYATGLTRGLFRIEAVEPGRLVALAGSHPFSRFRLTFALAEDGPGRTRLSARTDAAFPGPHGAVYRALVISSGGHAVIVRRMLRRIAAKATAHGPVGPSRDDPQ